jgi:hypothetical protein
VTLAQIAVDRFVSAVPGVHWDDLVKQYGSLDVVIQQRLYLPEMLQAAAEAAGPALAIGIDPNIRPDTYARGYSDVGVALNSQVTSIPETTSDNLSQSIQLPGPAFYAFLCGFMAMAGRSLDGHTTGMILKVGLTPQQVQVNADNIIREFRGFKYLWDSGALSPWTTSTQGLGNPYVVAAIFVVGSLIALGMLLWFRLAQTEQADKNAMQEKVCMYMLQTNSPEAVAYCTKFSKPDSSITNLPQKIIDSVMQGIVTPIVYIAGFGGLLALGIYMLPQIAEKWAASKGKW